MQEVSLACTGGEDDGKIFMYLCEIGDTAGVERALARFPLLIHTQDLETGATPLMCAGKSGSAQLLRLLATSGASLTARDKRGRTPAELGQEKGHAGLIVATASSQGCRRRRSLACCCMCSSAPSS
jgi:ankyrin repeat protein